MPAPAAWQSTVSLGVMLARRPVEWRGRGCLVCFGGERQVGVVVCLVYCGEIHVGVVGCLLLRHVGVGRLIYIHAWSVGRILNDSLYIDR